MIKTVVLIKTEEALRRKSTYSNQFFKYTTKKRTYFTKYIAENGNAVCTVNREIVEPEAGNDIYRKLKAEGAVVESREVTDENDKEIIEYIKSGIDKYVEYIDNYKQYAETKARNDELYKLASEFRRIAK